MNEQTAIQTFISTLDAALPADVKVRTAGGDSTDTPPYVVVRWRSERLSHENGANPFAAVTRDPDTGDATGREFHQYYLATADCTVTSYDEGERDDLVDQIDDAFLPYEYDAGTFHADTSEWEVGNTQPGSLPVLEPDWYEARKTIRFRYVKRVTQAADPLTSTQENVHTDESLDN